MTMMISDEDWLYLKAVCNVPSRASQRAKAQRMTKVRDRIMELDESSKRVEEETPLREEVIYRAYLSGFMGFDAGAYTDLALATAQAMGIADGCKMRNDPGAEFPLSIRSVIAKVDAKLKRSE